MSDSPMLHQQQNNAPMIGGIGKMPARDLAEALRYLGNKSDRPYKPSHGSPRATRVVRTDRGIGIKYHDTVVAEYTPEGLRLDSAGYRTLTTKARMNEALSAACGSDVHVSVWQQRGIWFVSRMDRNPDHNLAGQPYWINVVTMPYFDGITVSYSGVIVNPPDDNGAAELERVRADQRLIARYIAEVLRRIDVVHAMTEDNYSDELLPLPSGGDCWYCLMREVNTGRTLGDVTRDDHIRLHLEEVYIVPSLLHSALEEHGSRWSRVTLQALQEGNVPSDWDVSHLKDVIKRALRRYFKTRLSVAQ